MKNVQSVNAPGLQLGITHFSIKEDLCFHDCWFQHSVLTMSAKREGWWYCVHSERTAQHVEEYSCDYLLKYDWNRIPTKAWIQNVAGSLKTEAIAHDLTGSVVNELSKGLGCVILCLQCIWFNWIWNLKFESIWKYFCFWSSDQPILEKNPSMGFWKNQRRIFLQTRLVIWPKNENLRNMFQFPLSFSRTLVDMS